MENTSDPLRTIDAHTAGEPLRLVVDGWPAPKGQTMLARRKYARERQDRLRRVLMQEPRGHADMYGALLTEPERPDSDAGVLFMHNDGFSTMCGHGIIAVVTIAIERGLFDRAIGQSGNRVIESADQMSMILDAPAGQIRATATVERHAGRRRVRAVSFINVPSFVLAASLPIRLGARALHVDVAFGGAFYAIVDAESAGLAVVPGRLTELKQAGMEIKHAVESAMTVVHPEEAGLAGIYGTIFTGPPSREGAHLRNVTIFADREVDRSPCGTGTCAVLAVLDAMGLVDESQPFVHESILGTTFSARVHGRAVVAGVNAIIPELTGSASITGDHTFLVDADDVLPEGFRL